MNPDYTHIGVGYANSSGGYRHYWVQMFTGVRGGSTTTDTSKPDTSKPDDTTTTTPDTPNPSNPSNPSGQEKQVERILFSTPIVTTYPNHQYIVTLVDQNSRTIQDGITWLNESPDLISFDESRFMVNSKGQTGTAYLTAQYQGKIARLTIRIMESKDKVGLSTLSTTMNVGETRSTILYIYDFSKFYGQDYTCTWSVDDPSIVSLEESTYDGDPSVRFTALKVGDAKITCRVTGADGSIAEEYCFVHVLG